MKPNKLIVEFELRDNCLYRTHQISLLRGILSRFYTGIKSITVVRPYEEKVKLE